VWRSPRGEPELSASLYLYLGGYEPLLSKVEIKKNEGHTMLENMRATPTTYLVLRGDGTHS
jgi:hypothetical protein